MACALVVSLLVRAAAPGAQAGPIFFLIAIIVAAVQGYGPGILASAISIFGIPYLLNPNYNPAHIDVIRVVLILLVSILLSAMSNSRRRNEARLRRHNEELDARVRERTAAFEEANRALQQREEELQGAQSRLRDVLNSVDGAFLALDHEWRLTYANQRILENLGRTEQEAMGHSIWEFFPDGRDSMLERQFRRVLEERAPVSFEVRYPNSNMWWQVDAHPTPQGLTAFILDISRQREDAASLALLAGIVESSADAIVSKNLEGIILTWNPGAERMYGYSAAEAVGQSMDIVVPESRMGEERDILERMGRGENVSHFETIRRRKNGKEIQVSISISPLRGADGDIMGASHVARDITEQKQLQEQMRQMQRLESLGVLAGGVAHDFNNLLVGIIGNASLVLENASPRDRASLQDIVAAGQRAADLTRQLLAYAGKGKVYTQTIDLSALVREISHLVKASISRTIQVRLELEDDLPAIDADPGQVQQIIMNLVINAAEAMTSDSGGAVIVTTKFQAADEHYLGTTLGVQDVKPGNYVVLEVHDTGCGMDDATIARIFDPFFTTKFQGRGLGLSAVLGIVKGHHGALKVYSAPGRGTTFKVLFPASQNAAVRPALAASASDLAGSGIILVVDDEEMVRRLAKSALERLGYSVQVAADGQEAIETVRVAPGKIDVVLLDLTMPRVNGEEALRQIRQIDTHVPVIISSGFNETEALRRFAGKGVSGFIQKPYTTAELGTKVRTVLREARTAEGGSLPGHLPPPPQSSAIPS